MNYLTSRIAAMQAYKAYSRVLYLRFEDCLVGEIQAPGGKKNPSWMERP